jgi:hypothetical protein
VKLFVELTKFLLTSASAHFFSWVIGYLRILLRTTLASKEPEGGVLRILTCNSAFTVQLLSECKSPLPSTLFVGTVVTRSGCMVTHSQRLRKTCKELSFPLRMNVKYTSIYVYWNYFLLNKRIAQNNNACSDKCTILRSRYPTDWLA